MPILNWLGRDEALKTATNTPYRLLEEVPELGYGDKTKENMIVQGDNLEALKALLPFYAGQVKCIYIDPPYNTGSAFEHYDDNLEHSQWLSLIYPRLELLREFLSEDGSIWISIDDDEGHYLKVICDEVFGRKNFINNIIWQKKFSPQNDAKWFSDNHDHILCYAKNKEIWRPNLLQRTEEMNARYKNPDSDPRGVWTSGDLSAKTYSQNTDYPIFTPSGRKVNPPKSRSWIYTKEKLLELSAKINAAGKFKETFMVSALTGQQIDDFYKYLAESLPVSPWYYPEEQISDMPLKLLAAEIVREKLFLFLRQELPYALTVEPELWERREDGSVRAEITIYVERDSQKIIVLGKGGAMIKRIGQAARREIEDLLEERIHLFLFVKVRENWGEDPARYADWGLNFNA